MSTGASFGGTFVPWTAEFESAKSSTWDAQTFSRRLWASTLLQGHHALTLTSRFSVLNVGYTALQNVCKGGSFSLKEASLSRQQKSRDMYTTSALDDGETDFGGPDQRRGQDFPMPGLISSPNNATVHKQWPPEYSWRVSFCDQNQEEEKHGKTSHRGMYIHHHTSHITGDTPCPAGRGQTNGRKTGLACVASSRRWPSGLALLPCTFRRGRFLGSAACTPARPRPGPPPWSGRTWAPSSPPWGSHSRTAPTAQKW